MVTTPTEKNCLPESQQTGPAGALMLHSCLSPYLGFICRSQNILYAHDISHISQACMPSTVWGVIFLIIAAKISALTVGYTLLDII